MRENWPLRHRATKTFLFLKFKEQDIFLTQDYFFEIGSD